MIKIEVEHRGILTKERFNELSSFFTQNADFLGEKERFSIIYSQATNDDKDLYESPIDLKLRTTNKEAELVLKHGKWSGNDARREFSFPVEMKKFEEMVDFLKILGHYHGVLQATTTRFYNYQGVEFSLVDVPQWGYYFEAEIVVEEKDTREAEEKIRKICNTLRLNVLDHDGFCDLLKSLNRRPGFRFNFKKESFLDVKKRFERYF